MQHQDSPVFLGQLGQGPVNPPPQLRPFQSRGRIRVRDRHIALDPAGFFVQHFN